MRVKDERLKLMSDVLNGMRVLKLSSWETPMEAITTAIRRRELAALFKAQLCVAFIAIVYELAPMFVSVKSVNIFVVANGSRLHVFNKR